MGRERGRKKRRESRRERVRAHGSEECKCAEIRKASRSGASQEPSHVKPLIVQTSVLLLVAAAAAAAAAAARREWRREAE